MAPPLITGVDRATGRRRKIGIPGRIALPLFRMLRHGKAVRGTVFDPFGWQAERREERRSISIYEGDVARAIGAPHREAAMALVAWPMDVRGFGPVKAANWAAMAGHRAQLLGVLNRQPTMVDAA